MKDLKKERKSNPKANSKYKEVNCAVKKGMKAARENWTGSLLDHRGGNGSE